MNAVLAPPRSPFKGLAAFDDSDLDALFFFGRERERVVLVANLVAQKLTLLYGESGVGKSSLLAAGVVRELRTQSPDAAVLMYDVWSAPPDGVLETVRDSPEAYVILDQFEEYFLYDAEETRDLLPALLAEPHVQVLIALREDALAQLDVFKARIPFVFANQVRLDHLDRSAARAAIVGPIERWNELTGETISVEPELVDAILDEVKVEGRGDDRIEAPYLQLVLEQIWEREHDAGSNVLRRSTLEALGGAAAIVRGHLQGALAALSPPEQEVAAEMFAHLITPSGTKIAHNANDLAEYAEVPEETLRRVLGTLTRDRIVHSVDGSDRYEIFHDVLIEPIQSWRLQRRLEHERRLAARRQRRLLAIAIATAVALGIVAVIALFALEQRSRARDEARNARAAATQSHARELAAKALTNLARNPARSLELAVSAAGLERSDDTRDVLRTTLLNSYLDVIVPTNGPATAIALSHDARRVLAGDATGHAVLVDLGGPRRVAAYRLPGKVVAVAFAPVGRRLLVAGGGRVILAGGGRRVVLRHRGLRDAVFGKGDAEVATGGADGVVRLWDAADGRLLRTFTPGGVVRRVALSPDGSRLAAAWTGGAFPHATLYDAVTGDPIADIRGVTVVFNRDGSLLATSDAQPIAHVYRASDGFLIAELAHGGPVTDIAFAPDGEHVVTASADGAGRVFKIGRAEKVLLLPAGSTALTSASFTPDGSMIVTSGRDGVVHVWSSSNGRPLRSLIGHGDNVSDAVAGWNARVIVSAGNDGTVRVWRTGLQNLLALVGRTRGAVEHVEFVGGRVFAAAHRGLYEWRLGPPRPVTLLPFSRLLADGAASASSVAALARDGAVVLRPHGRRAVRVPPPGARIEFGPGGRKLLVAGGSTVELVDVGSGARAVAHVHGRVLDAAFAANGSYAVSTARGRVVVFSPEGTQTHVLSAGTSPQVAVAFSADGRLVAGAGRDGVAQIWSARTGNPHPRLKHGSAPLTDVAFSPNGRLLATSAVDGEAVLWRVDDGVLTHVLNGHSKRVAQVAFSPDSQWLLTAGPKSVGFWQASTGKLQFYLRGHRRQVESVAFSADGTRILTGSDDRTVRTYDCKLCRNFDALAALAKHQVVRMGAFLTPRERRRYLGG